MMKKKVLSTVVFVAFLIPTSCSAQEDRRMGPPKPETLMQEMDQDKDEKLSKSEVKGPLKEDFDKIDLDKDGFLTLEELKKAPKPKGKRPPDNHKR